MKKVQKIIAMVFLSLIISLSSLVPISAAEGNPADVVQGFDASSSKISFVATLTIVSYGSGGGSTSSDFNGHALLVVVNTSSKTITVGKKSVAKGSSVTIGTFGNRSSHKGIWYNVEGYNTSVLPSSRVGLRTALTGSQLSTLNKKINSSDKWTYTSNCSWFACNVWNSVAPSSYKVSAGTPCTPAKLCTSIKKRSGYIKKPSVPFRSIDSIGYYNGKKMVYNKKGAGTF